MERTKYINPKLIASTLRNLKQITFEVTDRCNLECKYCGYGCFYNNYDNREDRDLPIKKAILFLDYITDFWEKNPPAPRLQRGVYC